MINDPKNEQMVINFLYTTSFQRTTDIRRVLVVSLDQIIKIKGHVTPLKNLKVFAGKNFKSLLEKAIKPGF